MSFLKQQTRLVTGLTLAAVLAGALMIGGWVLRGLVLVASVLAMWEFLSMYWPGKSHMPRKILGCTLAAAVVIVPAFGPMWLPVTLCVAFCVVALSFLFSYGTGNTEIRLGHFAPLLHGILYIPLVLQLAMHLSTAEQFLVMAAAIATDTGGYYAGSRFGKHKMWPSISPKKSWEGALGGMILCVLLCLAMGTAGERLVWHLPVMPLWGWACLGIGLNMAAQLGDFFESAVKRTLEVKDSGTILPGHGGILDRVDSVLFVLPVYTLVCTLLVGI